MNGTRLDGGEQNDLRLSKGWETVGGLTQSGPLFHRCQDFPSLPKKQKKKDWIYFYPRRSVALGYLFDLMTFLLTLYQFHVSQSLYSSSKDEYLYHR